jgi:hypothetical protein
LDAIAIWHLSLAYRRYRPAFVSGFQQPIFLRKSNLSIYAILLEERHRKSLENGGIARDWLRDRNPFPPRISPRFLVLFPAAFPHCLYVEATIAFQAHPLTSISSRRATVRTVARPSELKVTMQNSATLRTLRLQMPPFESHPVDRLLPQSRLQQMKKLLERGE